MNSTKRLFDMDSHLFSFDATLLSVTEGEAGHLSVVLDQTAFFPEGGGQYADPGTLGGYPVVDVQERDGIIIHTVDVSADSGAHPFVVGATVKGVLDAEKRLVRMQNHSAEHILSGIIFRRWGYANVGFHLGDGDVTLDFDGELSRDQLNEVEDEANRIIRACLPIDARYPEPEELSKIPYRAKLNLTEGVRIVRVGYPEAPVDLCACCAPHVANTGEIGLIKMLDFARYKGGVRIHMLAGAWALTDYRRRYTETAAMAMAMSVRQEDILVGFERLTAELEEKKAAMTALKRRLQAMTVASIPAVEGSLCYIDEELEPSELRFILNSLTAKCSRLCGVFAGSDEAGYRYVIGRGDASIDLKVRVKEINTALSARGGGSSEMLQGSSAATRAVIEAFFAEN